MLEKDLNNRIVDNCRLTALFLFGFQDKKPQKYYREVDKEFLDSLKKSGLNIPEFQYANQGFLLMLLYGLLVYPKSLYEEKLNKLDDEQLNNIKLLFNNITITEKPPRNNFLQKVRNAIAHADVEVNISENKFVFRDSRDKKGKDYYFQAEISVDNIYRLFNILIGIYSH